MVNKEKAHETQKRLSNVNADFIDFVQDNPEFLKQSNFKTLKWTYDLIQFQPWPTFLSLEMRRRLESAGLSMLKLIKSVPKRIFNNDPRKISMAYGIPLTVVEFALKGLGQAQLDAILARGDFILTEDMELKCVEFNIASNLGGNELPLWESLYLQHPLIAKFIKKYNVKPRNINMLSLLLEHIVDTALTYENLNIKEGESINIIIHRRDLDPNNSDNRDTIYLNMLLQALLKQKYGNRYKGSVNISGYKYLDVIEEMVYFKGKKIHAVIEADYCKERNKMLGPYYNGNLIFVNGPSTTLTANKLNLAFISENEDSDIFSQEEREAIKKYLPWTRKTRYGETTFKGEQIKLEDFAVDYRENLILKPAKGYGGMNLHYGKSCTELEWKKLLKNAFKEKNWVLQDYVAPTSFWYQSVGEGCELHVPIWGTFFWGHRYGGTFLRAQPEKSTRGVINSHQGARISIVFDVDE